MPSGNELTGGVAIIVGGPTTEMVVSEWLATNTVCVLGSMSMPRGKSPTGRVPVTAGGFWVPLTTETVSATPSVT